MHRAGGVHEHNKDRRPRARAEDLHARAPRRVPRVGVAHDRADRVVGQRRELRLAPWEEVEHAAPDALVDVRDRAHERVRDLRVRGRGAAAGRDAALQVGGDEGRERLEGVVDRLVTRAVPYKFVKQYQSSGLANCSRLRDHWDAPSKTPIIFHVPSGRLSSLT